MAFPLSRLRTVTWNAGNVSLEPSFTGTTYLETGERSRLKLSAGWVSGPESSSVQLIANWSQNS